MYKFINAESIRIFLVFQRENMGFSSFLLAKTGKTHILTKNQIYDKSYYIWHICSRAFDSFWIFDDFRSPYKSISAVFSISHTCISNIYAYHTACIDFRMIYDTHEQGTSCSEKYTRRND